MDPRRYRLTEDLLPEAEVTFKTIDPVLPSPELGELRKELALLADSLDKRITLLSGQINEIRLDLQKLKSSFNWL